MSVSVVGFDLGSLTSYVVVARQGGVESVANEYSDRNTPSCISFNDKMRFIGHEAKQQQISNVKNTICNFSKFVGKTFNDKSMENEIKKNLCKIVEAEDQRFGFEVSYLNEKYIFSAEQVYAMQLTKMKEVAEMNLKTKVVDVVINVPTNATDSERRAILDAAKIANLNCIRIINDTTSCALAYGFYRQDLPETTEKSKIVAFVDMGYCNFQSALVAFNKGKMRVIASSCDNIGGRDFDQVIYDHVKIEFKQKYKLDVQDDKKPGVRLMQESEKLKKLMSANSTAIPMNIECFMNDIDVSTKMKRSEFEELSAPIFARVKSSLEKLLKEANITEDQVDSVEIVGGSSRVSAVKDIIAEVFKKELRTSLNSDEAVAKGCAFQCAILSPALRAKEFIISDACPYSISLSYDDVNGPELSEVYPKWHSFPASKQMTFNRNAPFKLEARYSDCGDLPICNSNIGVFNVAGVTPGPNGEAAKVKVKLRVNANGIFTCCQAQQVENVEKQVEVEVDAETMETNNINGDVNETVNENTTEKITNDKVNNEKPAKVKKMVTKTVTKNTDLPMQAMLLQYMPSRINEYNEKENSMIMQVKLEKEKAHAKNSVEEYVYEMRDKLYGELEPFISEVDRDLFSSELTSAENWLYEEGDDVAKQMYVDRLINLKRTGDMIVNRAREAYERPFAAEEFGRVCIHIQKIITAIDNKDEAYSHLDSTEKEVLVKLLEEKQAWFNAEVNRQRATPSYVNPILTAVQIYTQKQAIEAVAGPIINKPKPVVTPPPKVSDKTGDNDATNTSEAKVDKPEDMDLD